MDILFEDNHLIVAVKPPNLLTQADDTGDPDLLSQLKEYVKEKYNKPGDAYLGLVHRMDRPVGGLLVFARTSKAAARLSLQVREHTLNREYVCVCEGDTPDRFKLTNYLQKDEKLNKVRVLPDYLKNDGKLAVLLGRAAARREGMTLCQIRLETGRAHQIRAQMQAFNHPLWGDNKYGAGKPGQQIALWGMRLTFTHPTTGQRLVFVAPPPDEGGWSPFRRDIGTLQNLWPEVAP